MTAEARAAIQEWLDGAGVDYERPDDATFVVVLPGERKQKITTTFTIGEHYATVQAFVARHPDENTDGVHRWLLERNRSTYVVAYCIDHLGDIYLSGRMPVAAVTVAECDRIFGSVLSEADDAFNSILSLGFATAIRKEWAWRLERGESTANLAAFEHLRPSPPS
jgi:hypothetical protein